MNAGSARPARRDSLIEALHAPSPSADHAGHAGLFGQFTGSWDLRWFGRNSSGEPAQLPGELHAGWVLGGRAVQDVWIVPRRDTPGQPGAAGFHGTTIRFYDPATGAWRSTWIDPPNGKVRRFTATPAGTEIVLLSDEERPILRWTFTDITPDTFRWIGEVGRGGETTFDYQQHILARRRASDHSAI